MLKSLRRDERLTASIVGIGIVALNVILLAAILQRQNYMPHSVCWRGDSSLIWTVAVSNGVIFASYIGISAALLRTVFLVNLGPLAPVATLFGFFILTCGLTHLMDVVMIWYGAFWLQAIVTVICTIPSLVTAIYVARHAHDILELSRTIFAVYAKEPDGS